MLKRLRPGLFSANRSLAYRQRQQYIASLMLEGMTKTEARTEIKVREKALRNIPLPGERCGAHARHYDRPCRAAALSSGRCKLHGNGGHHTAAGHLIAMRNLRQNVRVTAFDESNYD